MVYLNQLILSTYDQTYDSGVSIQFLSSNHISIYRPLYTRMFYILYYVQVTTGSIHYYNLREIYLNNNNISRITIVIGYNN